MIALLDVIQVKVLEGYRLELIFENQEKKIFDMKGMVEKAPFIPLKDVSVFQTAKIDYGTVVWNNGFDIDPEILYERSVTV